MGVGLEILGSCVLVCLGGKGKWDGMGWDG
jgi:hypothetical protein